VQITTNEVYVQRRGRIGLVASFAGFIVLAIGVYFALQQSTRTNPSEVSWIVFIPWVTFLAGYVLTNIGKHYTTHYGGRPRVDVALAQSLKGLDSRNYLFSFVPTIPAQHVLVTQNAVVVIDPRPFIGEITHRGERWSRPLSPKGLWDRFSDGGLGNPTAEARRDAAAVETVLRERLGDEVMKSIVVLPIIVCTNPRLKLQLDDPEVPVVMLADLRGAIRKLREGTRMPSDVQRQIVQAFQWGTSTTLAPESTTRSKAWQRTQK
jgi:hypothetical protein